MNRQVDGWKARGPSDPLGAVAWLSVALAPAAMVIGHMGDPNLSWKTHQISTFAARGLHDGWITAAMLLSALAMVCIGAMISGTGRPGGKIASGLIAMALGGSVSGLLLLAAFEETATGMAALGHMSLGAIRQQSFHDAGLLIFFYGAIFALIASGIALFAERGALVRSLGAAVATSGPLAYTAMTASWPAVIGIGGAAIGLKQRIAFLLLWAGALLLLAAVTRLRQDTR